MRKLLLVLWGIVFADKICGQEMLINDSIKYQIVRVSRGISANNSLNKSGLFVKMKMESNCRKILLCKDSIYWLRKLEDPKSDWAATVTLYYLYAREAAVIDLTNRNKIAFSAIKPAEIAYWRSFLSALKKPTGCPE
ncbi:MAG: hypothetical protein DI535_19010 [Citrobacter freundii]|nr:MAG: hypothetical protein DI535_19010 [Citrobacter freundii]